jgi:hypothetical protein
MQRTKNLNNLWHKNICFEESIKFNIHYKNFNYKWKRIKNDKKILLIMEPFSSKNIFKGHYESRVNQKTNENHIKLLYKQEVSKKNI